MALTIDRVTAYLSSFLQGTGEIVPAGSKLPNAGVTEVAPLPATRSKHISPNVSHSNRCRQTLQLYNIGFIGNHKS